MKNSFFKIVEPAFFNVFSGKNREINYEILQEINYRMKDNFNSFEKREILSWIKEYINNHPAFKKIDDENEEIEFQDTKDRAMAKINYFVKAGWLSSETIRFKQVFTMNYAGISILSAMSDIVRNENLTSFKALKDKNSVVIFLSGFNSHTKQMLLKKIYDMYPNKKYFHFGDIDVGGFRIFNHLKYSTKIPFEPYRMGISELKGNKMHLKPLTYNDIKNLHLLNNDSHYDLFKEEIDYMLENNVKLEQEVLDESLLI